MPFFGNLVQDADVQLRLQRGLAIKGVAAPAPTLAPELVPVVIAKDLTDDGRERLRYWSAAAEGVADGPNGWPAAVGFANLPASPNAPSNTTIFIEGLMIGTNAAGRWGAQLMRVNTGSVVNQGQIGYYRDSRLLTSGGTPVASRPWVTVFAGATQVTHQFQIDGRSSVVSIIVPVSIRLDPDSYFQVECAAIAPTNLTVTAWGWEKAANA